MSLHVSSALKAPICSHVHNDLGTVNEALAGRDMHLLISSSSISLSVVSDPCSHNFISSFTTPRVVLLIRLLLQWLILGKVDM